MDFVKGVTYRLMHKRKGIFVALYLGDDPGDTVDERLLLFRIDTRPRTGQERLARARGAIITDTAIRPSLLINAEELPDSDWHIQLARHNEPTPPPPRRKPWYTGLRRLGIKYLRRDLFRKWAERDNMP